MPKMKTHKGVKKRFKVSARGKVTHHRPGKSHLLSVKTAKRRRRLRKPQGVTIKALAKRIRRALGR